jgi:hypothetical protein
MKAPIFSLDNWLTDGGKVVSLAYQLPSIPQEDSWYSFLLEAESTTRAIVRLEGVPIETRTCDLPACSIVSQPTKLPQYHIHNRMHKIKVHITFLHLRMK